MSEYPEAREKEEQVSSLVEELGTDPLTLGKAKYNRRLTTRLWDPADVPVGYKSELWLETYAELFQDIAVLKMVEIHRDLSNAIRGTRINELIKAEQVKRGIAVRAEPDIKEPGFFQRLFDRNYEERERARLGLEQQEGTR